MARHPSRPRGKRGADQPDDAFVATIDRTVAWMKEHQRAVIIGAIALVLLVAGAIYYINMQRSIENEAARRFTELQGTIASGNVQLAVRDLQNFVNRFGGTSAGEQARITLADLLLSQDQPEEAIDALGNLPRDLDDPLGLTAARIQAAALESMDRRDEAVDLYRRIADNARFAFQRREALADAARVRLDQNQPEAAAELLARVVDTYDAGEAGRGYYEMWLAEARALASEAGRRPDAEASTTAPGAVEGDEGAGATAGADTAGV